MSEFEAAIATLADFAPCLCSGGFSCSRCKSIDVLRAAIGDENRCGDDNRPGSGEPIGENDVYRCTDCGVGFHRLCAVEHFARNGLTTAVDVAVFNLMRDERNAARRERDEFKQLVK